MIAYLLSLCVLSYTQTKLKEEIYENKLSVIENSPKRIKYLLDHTNLHEKEEKEVVKTLIDFTDKTYYEVEASVYDSNLKPLYKNNTNYSNINLDEMVMYNKVKKSLKKDSGSVEIIDKDGNEVIISHTKVNDYYIVLATNEEVIASSYYINAIYILSLFLAITSEIVLIYICFRGGKNEV